ncbi:MAG: MqnA/MqnD/SBP family protein [Candidatus Eisenbacteria bacterium]
MKSSPGPGDTSRPWTQPGPSDSHARGPRVARIPYLNAYPFYVRWEELEERGWSSITMPPRQLGVSMERGDVDAGLMAVCDLIRLEAEFEPVLLTGPSGISSLGIANQDRVDSVLLFVRADDSDRTLGGRRPSLSLSPENKDLLESAVIGVTGESSTSFRLLRLLLEVRHKIRPTYRRKDLSHVLEPDLAAVLVIGDLALRWRYSPPPGWVQVMDLAREWREWTGRPFVFARWAVRRALPERVKLDFARFLESSLADGLGQLGEIAARTDIGVEPDHVRAYLENLTYRLGPQELEAESRFRELLSDHGIVCSAE